MVITNNDAQNQVQTWECLKIRDIPKMSGPLLDYTTTSTSFFGGP